jgi:uncharacterized OsmC-like protein
MTPSFDVVASAGSLRATGDRVVAFAHRWTEAGVAVEADFTGAHLLHLAAAGCVLNDVYREAERLGVAVDGVRVTAAGRFDDSWSSTGIGYAVEIDSAAAPDEVARLLAVVDEVAEIPRALRAGASVHRVTPDPGR